MNHEKIDLVVRAQHGDRGALNDLLRLEHEAVWRYLHLKMGDTLRRDADTEDLVQSALLEAARSIGSLRDPGAFSFWVRSIAWRALVGKRRRVAVIDRQRDTADVEGLAKPVDGALATDVREILNSLYPRHPLEMLAFASVHLDGLTLLDVAEIWKEATGAETSERTLRRRLRDAENLIGRKLRRD